MAEFAKGGCAAIAKALRYIRYVVETLRPVSFASWRDMGEPTPFVKERKRYESATESEILRSFSKFLDVAADQAAKRPRSRALTRDI